MSRFDPAYAAYGAIDLGTNNCRLLIARPSSEGFDVVDAFSRIVRLGEGLAETGRLSEAAMDRTIDALKVCSGRLHRKSTDYVRAVTTEACRRASNVDDFLDRVKTEVGLDLEVITPQQEAELALRGCWQLVDPEAKHLMLFDIGGGSTEIMWVTLNNNRLSKCERIFQSWPLGVVGLSEQFSDGIHVGPREYQAMVEYVVPHFRQLDQQHDLSRVFAEEGVQFIGTSGTMTTLAAVQMGLERYDRRQVDGQDISGAEYRYAAQQILNMSLKEREDHPCIGPGRADLVIAGCAILEALSQVWPCTLVRVADRGLREGILINMMRLAARGQLDVWSGASADRHSRPAS